jgi:hypothetical protein
MRGARTKCENTFLASQHTYAPHGAKSWSERDSQHNVVLMFNGNKDHKNVAKLPKPRAKKVWKNTFLATYLWMYGTHGLAETNAAR